MPSLDPSALDAALLAELRETLAAADYTVDRVVAAMGPIAHAALARNHTVPAERALTGRDDPLATLIRLWPLQRPVDRAAVEAALPGLVAPLIRAGILTARGGGTITATVDLRPYATDDADFWVFSDLTPGLDSHVAPMRRTSCSVCRRLPARWPSSRSGGRSPPRSISAPAAACRPCTWPPTPRRSPPPT